MQSIFPKQGLQGFGLWGTVGSFAARATRIAGCLLDPTVSAGGCAAAGTLWCSAQSEQDDQAVVEASEVAQQTQEQGAKPQPDTVREAPPPPAEKPSKSKDGTLTEKEGRATGAAPPCRLDLQ